MDKNSHSQHFMLFCLVASLTVVFLLFQPFLIPLSLAAMLAFLFQPLYQKFLSSTRNHSGLSALATVITAIIVILVPISFLGVLIFQESATVYSMLLAGDHGEVTQVLEDRVSQVLAVLPGTENIEVDIGQYARQGLTVVVSHLGGIFSSLGKLAVSALVFVIALYFFLKDGPKLTNYLIGLSPLDDRDDEIIVSRLELAVSATVKSSLLIGIIQGVLTGIGFAIFGVPNPALWGGVAAFAALIPGVGTALVIIPAILFLFFIGSTADGLGLLLWGTIAVGLIDNFLGPKLVGEGVKIHPLVILLAVLGGIGFFGPAGFILGPLTVSVLFALLDIYRALIIKK